MRKIFISYANDRMAYSLQRIGRQARKLGIFDDVILYTPEKLPKRFTESSLMDLMKYPRGAGFMCWKPVIIRETLNRYEDAIVVYVDAGCTLRQSSMWSMLFRLMGKYDTICFQYDKEQPQWEKLGATSSEMFHWTKQDTLLFLDSYLGSTSYRNYSQIMTGVLIMKGTHNALLSEWENLIYKYPHLLTDPTPEEKSLQHSGFIAHRHDQSLFSALATKYPNVLILPEIIEKYSKDAFVYASRIRAKNLWEGQVISLKHFFRRLFGDTFFDKIKNIVH